MPTATILGRLSLRTKLLLAPAAGVIALALVAGAAYWGLAQQRQKIAEIDDVRFSRLQLVMEADASTEEATHDLERLLAAPRAGLDPALAAVSHNEVRGKIRSVMGTLEYLVAQPRLDAGEKTAIDETIAHLRDYARLLDELLKAGRLDAESVKKLQSASEVLSWSQARLISVERELTSAAFAKSEQASRRLTWGFLAVLAAALAASLAASWIVTRHIRANVAAIHTAATELTRGNLAARAQVQGSDEIGATARAFNFLVDELARRAQERFRLAMDESPNALVLVDRATWKVLDANVTAARLAGLARDEFMASDNWELRERRGLRPSASGELERIYDEAIARAPQTAFEEAMLVGANGRAFPAEVGRRAIRIEGRWVILVSIRDISERKQVEAELKRRLDSLARSNAELERFAYVASHDLAEPLRMVASYSQLLNRRYRQQLDADAGEFIDFINDGARRMHRLLEDLLAYSRVGRVERKPREVPLDGVIDDVLDNLQLLVSEKGAIIEHAPLPVVRGDRTELVQLFQNLVGNALKFQDGSRVPAVRIAGEAADGGWRFSVADNGIGIAPEYFERIFTIFQRLHAREAYSGTGIGLAICRKIVETHGGRIWLESSPAGTTFHFTWPGASAPAA